MLHLIFSSPVAPVLLERMSEGDDALFLSDAVFSVLNGGILADLLNVKSLSIRFYALNEDVALRGITPAELAQGLEVIDYAKFVQITTENSLIQSWG